MPRIVLSVEASRHTTREGDHEDDQIYLKQIHETVSERLRECGFPKSTIRVAFAEAETC